MRLGVKLMLKGLFVIGTGLFWLFTHTSADILASMRLGVRLMLIGLFCHMNRALLTLTHTGLEHAFELAHAPLQRVLLLARCD